MKTLTEQNLSNLFKNWCNEEVISVETLPPSGSYREYFRLSGISKTCIGTYNADLKENIAFISFSKSFFNCGLPVPEIFAQNLEKHIYLQSDLGAETLFSYINKLRNGENYTPQIIEMYEKVIAKLPHFQVTGGKNIDYSVCYPRASFDKQSMMWDANYFKYYFLKLAQIPFDEQDLEDDFQTLTDYLLESPREFFLYRDFQSRNIMIYNNQPYFIDYQGGRKGALQYDLASLLYDGKADMPQDIRNFLLDTYIAELNKLIDFDALKFKQFFQGYVFIRIMQAMGAYGFRGFYEQKTHFLQSIPYALKNLEYLLQNQNLPIKIPTLLNVLQLITKSEKLKKIGKSTNTLKVTIMSFSYKKGLPVDNSGNGGGFIFDCRAINNPGRIDEYKHLTGKDLPVISFLDNEPEMDEFLKNAFTMVDNSINKYLQRSFQNLMICFGCTGGQHRSVYAAEKLTKQIKQKYDNIDILTFHREQDNK